MPPLRPCHDRAAVQHARVKSKRRSARISGRWPREIRHREEEPCCTLVSRFCAPVVGKGASCEMDAARRKKRKRQKSPFFLLAIAHSVPRAHGRALRDEKELRERQVKMDQHPLLLPGPSLYPHGASAAAGLLPAAASHAAYGRTDMGTRAQRPVTRLIRRESARQVPAEPSTCRAIQPRPHLFGHSEKSERRPSQ